MTDRNKIDVVVDSFSIYDFDCDIDYIVEKLKSYKEKYPDNKVFLRYDETYYFHVKIQRDETDEEYADRMVAMDADRNSQIKLLKAQAELLGLDVVEKVR